MNPEPQKQFFSDGQANFHFVCLTARRWIGNLPDWLCCLVGLCINDGYPWEWTVFHLLDCLSSDWSCFLWLVKTWSSAKRDANGRTNHTHHDTSMVIYFGSFPPVACWQCEQVTDFEGRFVIFRSMWIFGRTLFELNYAIHTHWSNDLDYIDDLRLELLWNTSWVKLLKWQQLKYSILAILTNTIEVTQ